LVDRRPPARAGKLSPFQLYQFLLGSVPDADVFRFLRQLTFLPLAELGALEAAAGSAAYAPNTAQRLLAAEVTRFVHGPDGLAAALAATAVRPTPHHSCVTLCVTLAPAAGLCTRQPLPLLDGALEALARRRFSCSGA